MGSHQCLRIHGFDLFVVFRRSHLPLELQCGCQFCSFLGEITVDNVEFLNLLSVGRGLGVRLFYSLFNVLLPFVIVSRLARSCGDTADLLANFQSATGKFIGGNTLFVNLNMQRNEHSEKFAFVSNDHSATYGWHGFLEVLFNENRRNVFTPCGNDKFLDATCDCDKSTWPLGNVRVVIAVKFHNVSAVHPSFAVNCFLGFFLHPLVAGKDVPASILKLSSLGIETRLGAFHRAANCTNLERR
mmetsp:Transcript_7568/g.21001  ORF Transcript_7568/g.21001 Transcript_7568/m.21001 type:complete len:243 (-) Transcript_7568:1416-2144(-)